MESSVEALDDSKVKLTIAVPEAEFDAALDAAFTKIAREVKIPGFRPGRAPRKVLEARIGVDAARDEALRDALPDYYAQALATHDVDAIAMPEIDITDGQSSGDVTFEAIVEVRPVVEIDGYLGLHVEIDAREVSDEAVDAQVDALRDRFADLAESDDPLTDGAYATIDLTGRQDGTEVDGLSVTDFLYEVGSDMIVAELDTQLRGKRPGDILVFESELPERFGDQAGAQVEFSVIVKETKTKVLPDLDDEWAAEASEFETVDELRADLRSRLSEVVAARARIQAREEVLRAAADLVGIEAPTSLVDSEAGRRIHDLGHRLEHQGANLEQYLAATGRSQEDFVAELRADAGRAVLADLALRAVTAAESVDATDDELEAQIGAMATELDRSAEDVRGELEQNGALETVRSDLARGKALDLLVEHATVVDADGNVLDVSVADSSEPASDSHSVTESDKPQESESEESESDG